MVIFNKLICFYYFFKLLKLNYTSNFSITNIKVYNNKLYII